MIDHRTAYGDVWVGGGPVYVDVDALAQLSDIAMGTKGLAINSGFPRALSTLWEKSICMAQLLHSKPSGSAPRLRQVDISGLVRG